MVESKTRERIPLIDRANLGPLRPPSGAPGTEGEPYSPHVRVDVRDRAIAHARRGLGNDGLLLEGRLKDRYNHNTAAFRKIYQDIREERVPKEEGLRLAQACVDSVDLWINQPVHFAEFCKSLDGMPLFRRQKAAFENAGWATGRDLFSPLKPHQEIVYVWGKGSGKDFLISKFNAYIAYLIGCLCCDPATFFSTAPGTRLDVLNVAPNEDVALNVYFSYLKRWMSNELVSPFKPIIKANEVLFYIHHYHTIDRFSPETKDVPTLRLASRHSRASGLDGFNLLCWVMDEADDFLDTEKRSNAHEIHNLFRSSSGTRFDRMWNGMVISYPRTADGFLMGEDGLVKRAGGGAGKGDDPTIWVDIATTFEVNPMKTREDPTIKADFDNNPEEASAHYDCIPMPTESAWISFSEKVDAAILADRSPIAIVNEKPIVSPDGIHQWIGAVIESEIRVEPGRAYFLGGDGGVSKDSFCLSIVSVDDSADEHEWVCAICAQERWMMEPTAGAQLPFAKWVEDQGIYRLCQRDEVTNHHDLMDIACGTCYEIAANFGPTRLEGWMAKKPREAHVKETYLNGVEVTLPYVREELLLEFRPYRRRRPGEANKTIHVGSMAELTEALITRIGVKESRFDPWQTVQLTQGLATKGLMAGSIGFTNPDQYARACVYKSLLYNGLIGLLPNDKRDSEVKRLQHKNGKIDHPEGASKDLYDAEAVAVWLACIYKDSRIATAFLGEMNTTPEKERT